MYDWQHMLPFVHKAHNQAYHYGQPMVCLSLCKGVGIMKVSLYFKHGETTQEQIIHRFKDFAPIIQVPIEMLALIMTTDMADSEGVMEYDTDTNTFSVRETHDGL